MLKQWLLLNVASENPPDRLIKNLAVLLQRPSPHPLQRKPAFPQNVLARLVPRIGHGLDPVQPRPRRKGPRHQCPDKLGCVAVAPGRWREPVAQLPGAVVDVAFGLQARTAHEQRLVGGVVAGVGLDEDCYSGGVSLGRDGVVGEIGFGVGVAEGHGKPVS